MRFFFNSFRYSEDMDLDAAGISVDSLKDIVMGILKDISFQNNFKPFGIESVIPPDIKIAKQTSTTQRFKIHLITFAGEDLFTKVEFSRRGFFGQIFVQPVLDRVLRPYKLPPLLVPHYDIQSAVTQKVNALATRTVTQARDIFDLYILSSQWEPHGENRIKIEETKLKEAGENSFSISFEQFRDSVVAYLSIDDKPLYNSSSVWDEIILKVTRFLEELRE